MKRFTLILLFAALVGLSAQAPKVPSCGLAGDHPCHCIKHVEQVQKEHMDACMATVVKDKPSEALAYCMSTMPQHCSIVEHYGNWESGEDGEHVNPMPNQCTKACKWGHCRCADGPICHFSHPPGGG